MATAHDCFGLRRVQTPGYDVEHLEDDPLSIHATLAPRPRRLSSRPPPNALNVIRRGRAPDPAQVTMQDLLSLLVPERKKLAAAGGALVVASLCSMTVPSIFGMVIDALTAAPDPASAQEAVIRVSLTGRFHWSAGCFHWPAGCFHWSAGCRAAGKQCGDWETWTVF